MPYRWRREDYGRILAGAPRWYVRGPLAAFRLTPRDCYCLLDLVPLPGRFVWQNTPAGSLGSQQVAVLQFQPDFQDGFGAGHLLNQAPVIAPFCRRVV